MTTLEMLKELCGATGVAGEEFSASEKAAELLRAYTDNVEIDSFGSVISRIPGKGENCPTLLLDAHIDQIGMIVTHITDEGFLRVSRCGGVDRRLLLAQQVIVHGKKPLVGIVGTKPPHLTSAEETKQVPEIEDIAIDVGYTKEELEELVCPGDRVTYDGDFLEMQNGRVSSKSLDDRSGVAAILYALEQIKGKDLSYNLVIVFSVQEEVGGTGAATTAFRLAPDEAIAVDVSFAKTADLKQQHIPDMGTGAMIGISPILNRGMFDELVNLAKEGEIPYTLEAMGGRTGTNADEISVAAGGVRTGLLSIPLKYMHTPVEMVQISDVEAVGKLIAAYILR